MYISIYISVCIDAKCTDFPPVCDKHGCVELEVSFRFILSSIDARCISLCSVAS